MAQTLDFIDSASNGYQFIWRKRDIIWRLAIPVLIIKIISYISIYALGYSEDHMKQGLLLLPSNFVEGWLLVVLIQMEMFKEKPPQQFNIQKIIRDQKILPATLIFVIIKLMTAFFAALAMQNGLAEFQAGTEPTEESEQSLGVFLLAVAGFTFFLWAFRLVWLYIPVAMNIPVVPFLKRIKSFGYSFYLIGIWMVCALPIMIGLLFTAQIIGSAFPADGEEISIIHRTMVITAQSVTELIVSIISSIAIAYSIYSVMFDSKFKRD